jgi:hypothetical protein
MCLKSLKSEISPPKSLLKGGILPHFPPSEGGLGGIKRPKLNFSNTLLDAIFCAQGGDFLSEIS